MAKQLLIICFFVALLAIAFGAVSIIPADPRYPGKCFSKETGVMELRQVKFLKDCARAECSGGEIEIATCGVVSFVGKCVLEEDFSKDYPGCCPEPKCE